MDLEIPSSLYNYLSETLSGMDGASRGDRKLTFIGSAGLIVFKNVNDLEFMKKDKKIVSETIIGGYKYCLTKEIINEHSEGSKCKGTGKKRNKKRVESGASRNIQRKA